MTNLGFHFGTVYVRDRGLADVSRAVEELMAEAARQPTDERGLDPTPDELTEAKPIRSFALVPMEDGWTTVLEDGHPLDDGGLALGLSDVLAAEAIHLRYSDSEGFWEYTRYLEGQPLEAGGADDDDFDVGALDFVNGLRLPHFGVYYEEVAVAAGERAPALAGALTIAGGVVPRIPIGTEIRTFRSEIKPRLQSSDSP